MKLGIAISQRLPRDNIHVVSFIEQVKRSGLSWCYEKEDKSFDLLVTFGGDGLTLFFAKKYASICPVLAVNLGTIGFLSQIEPNIPAYEFALGRLVNEEYSVIERSLLQVQSEDKVHIAFNDMLVCSTDRSKTTTVSLTLNHSNIGSVAGDGVIVTTPTGSTAYCRSLGGPVLTQDCGCFAILAIAPLNRFSPVCYADSNTLTIDCVDRRTQFYVDNEQIDFVVPCTVIVTKSDKKALTVQFDDTFFAKLRPQDKVKVPR